MCESSNKSSISNTCEIGVTKSQKGKKIIKKSKNINKKKLAGPSTSDPGLFSVIDSLRRIRKQCGDGCKRQMLCLQKILCQLKKHL